MIGSAFVGIIAAEVIVIFVLIVFILKSSKETRNYEKQLKKIHRDNSKGN